MTNWQLFHYPSPVSFYAWYGDVTIAERLLSEWGWIIDRREPATPDVLAQFLASAPEPGLDREPENAVLSHWNGWHLLVTYFSFGSLREIYANLPVPIIEFTVSADTDLAQLGSAKDLRLDLMVGQRYYWAYIRDGVLWRSEMESELRRKTDGQIVLLGGQEAAVEWQLGEGIYPGYSFQDRILFSASLDQNLELLGLPIWRWQNRDTDIVNEALEIVSRP